jgi:aspartate aminotransferase-like enzyme
MIHHRTDEFGRMLGSVIEKLRPLFGTSGDILPVHSTGRGALEAAITNLCSPGDEVVVCCDGVFGEMWADIADAFGVVAHRISANWGVAVDPAEVEAAFLAHPRARAVLLAHSDTSTGALNDVAGIARVARRADALVMVDGVSSIGGTPFRFVEWGVDVAITASQKCLMSSPGIAFVAVSQRAWDAHSTARLPRSYFDFQAIRKTLARARPETPSTTPVHLIAQVNAALELIEAEGLDQIFARHEEMALIARSRAAALGLSPQCPGLINLSPTLTGLRPPDGVSPARIREQLKTRGILVGPGLRRYEPTCFRIGHMGDIRPADVHRTMDALAEVLGAAGR